MLAHSVDSWRGNRVGLVFGACGRDAKEFAKARVFFLEQPNLFDAVYWPFLGMSLQISVKAAVFHCEESCVPLVLLSIRHSVSLLPCATSSNTPIGAHRRDAKRGKADEINRRR